MNLSRLVSLGAVVLTAACAQTPAAPEPAPSNPSLTAGGFTPTGNPVMDAALMAANQAAAQSDPPAGAAAPGAVDSSTGLAAPFDGHAAAVAAAAPDREAAYTAGSLPAGTLGTYKDRPLVAAAESGEVKIECYYSNFPADREFIPMEVKVTPLVRLDDLVVKVDPEDGVIMRDGPMSKSIATPSDPFFRRIFAMRATDRDSYLRISTVTKVTGKESQRSVLCPLARSNRVADTRNP